MAKREIADYPEIGKIIERLKGGKPSEVIIVFVPSHDRKNKKLPDALKKIWADEALTLFGRLFTGATAFENLKGIYQPEKHLVPIYDEPIMIQSLTATENIENEDNLYELADFCRNMGKKMNQASIGVIVNNLFINIDIKH